MRRFENLKITTVLIVTTILFFSCGKKEKIHMRMPASHRVEKCDADFDVFFKKFASDSVFQKMHTKFPLKNSHLDDDYHNMVREDIPLSKYTFADFSNNSELYDIDFMKKSDSLFYRYRGRDNGIYGTIKFAFENGCWKMVEIIDEST